MVKTVQEVETIGGVYLNPYEASCGLRDACLWDLLDDLYYYHKHPKKIKKPDCRMDEVACEKRQNYYYCMEEYNEEWISRCIKLFIYYDNETKERIELNHDNFLDYYFKHMDSIIGKSREYKKVEIKKRYDKNRDSEFLIDRIYYLNTHQGAMA